MNNPRLSPIVSVLLIILLSLIISTHARYHHTEVIPRRHRHRHHSGSLNSVSYRLQEHHEQTKKSQVPYEDEDPDEDYEEDNVDEDYSYEELERPRRRRFRDRGSRIIANHRDRSRLNSRRRFFIRERNYEPDFNYYDDDYNFNYNYNHNFKHNYNHRKDFARGISRRNFLRKNYGRKFTGKKFADYEDEEEQLERKRENLTAGFLEHDKESDEEKEEEEIWNEAEEEEEEDEEEDDRDNLRRREYRNIEVNGSRGLVRKEVRSASADNLNLKFNLKERPLKIRVRDEDYDRRREQSDNRDEPEDEEEEETSAPTTTSPPKSTTMMSSPAVSATGSASASASRPVITGQTYERRDSRFSDPTSTSSSFSPTSHGPHKVPVKEIKSLPSNNNTNKNGKSAEIREALQHAMKVSREGSCQWPRARVIPVRDVYPSPSTTYIPHCAILHRCSDDTGCCRSESLTCVPKQFHKVQLYFYTTSIGGGSVVEKLSFYNHTECECREKSEYGVQTQSDNKLLESDEFKSHVSSSKHQSLVPQNIRKPVTKKPCRCPSEFTPRMNFDGECMCDCFENDQDCFRARRGKGYFSLRDRLCIQNEECAVPSCEFGDYIKRQGRCPRKKEKFDEIANYQNQMNYHNRHRS